MKLLKLSGVVVGFYLLAGCGGSSGSDAICQAIGNSGSVISQSAGVQIDQSSLAFDGDIATAAELYSISGSGSAEFSVSGGPTSASFAGVLLDLPQAQVTQVNVEVLLNGAVVTSGNAGTQSDTSQACPGICQQQGELSYFGIPVEEAFDEIRATLQISGTTADTLVYELCVKR